MPSAIRAGSILYEPFAIEERNAATRAMSMSPLGSLADARNCEENGERCTLPPPDMPEGGEETTAAAAQALPFTGLPPEKTLPVSILPDKAALWPADEDAPAFCSAEAGRFGMEESIFTAFPQGMYFL